MTTSQKLQYAQSRLALAKMMGDTPEEITKWQEHVEYWKELLRRQQVIVRIAEAGGEVCQDDYEWANGVGVYADVKMDSLRQYAI